MSASVAVRQEIFRFEESETAKIEGGFVAIPVKCLAIVWWAYRTKRISRAAFRAYFACHELETRRALLRRKYDREYERVVPDFIRLLGGDPKQEKSKALIRSAFRELREFGLVIYGNDHVFRFVNDPNDLKLTDEARTDLNRTLEKFANPKRPVPVARRILRRLAGGMSRSRTGVLIAYLVRCLFYRKEEGVTAKGCCKASWIAEAFSISKRSVFDARDYLIHELGWLTVLPTPQKVLNRFGLWVTVNLSWNEKKNEKATEAESNRPVQNLERPGEATETQFADPSGQNPHDFADPLETSLPSLQEGSKNQNRPPVETTEDMLSGFRLSQEGSEKAEETSSKFSPTDGGGKKLPGDDRTCPPPDIRNVVAEDLKDFERLCELRKQAIADGFMTESEADRVRFFAAVVHARNVGKNPVKLFSWMIRSKRWEMITQADEEEAIAKLKAKERQRSGIQEERRGRSLPTLSDDARLVQAVLTTYRERRVPCWPRLIFDALERHDSAWTERRFVMAWSELHPDERPFASKTH